MTGGRISRRAMLWGLLAGAAAPAWGEALLRSPRPPERPLRGADGSTVTRSSLKVAARPAEELIAEAKLGGAVCFAVADAKTGMVLETRGADDPMPPASTLKALTSLYALEALGDRHRFETRLIATGPVAGGIVQGDLVLAGGGDPTLTTDGLGDMAAALKARGVTGVTGRFVVWGGALPYVRAIDPGQPDYLGYNPAVSGINLNFNRVNCEWRRAGEGYEIGMDARAERFVPRVDSARVTISEREFPVFSYSEAEGAEYWSVARPALGKGGSRWLPVRHPEAYAGDVFRTLAEAQGIRLPKPEVARALPSGEALVSTASEELRPLLKAMMKHSTNLTAEAVGMAASGRLGTGGEHDASARAMAGWLSARAGISAPDLADHSGLGAGSRISAGQMVRAIQRLGPQAGLRGLMKPHVFKEEGGVAGAVPVLVEAKTGTLNFVSALAGFMTAPDGTELVFAILTGDVARRDAVPVELREAPQGARSWATRSRRLQQQLIERWGAVYGA